MSRWKTTVSVLTPIWTDAIITDTYLSYANDNRTTPQPSKAKDDESSFQNLPMFLSIGAVLLMLLVFCAIIAIFIICKKNRKPKANTANIDSAENMIPVHANVENHDQGTDIEYAEINMNLLVPRPEKESGGDDSDPATIGIRGSSV